MVMKLLDPVAFRFVKRFCLWLTSRNLALRGGHIVNVILHRLTSFPFLDNVAVLDALTAELSVYLAKAANVSPAVCNLQNFLIKDAASCAHYQESLIRWI